jgi:hypothetical protein
VHFLALVVKDHGGVFQPTLTENDFLELDWIVQILAVTGDYKITSRLLVINEVCLWFEPIVIVLDLEIQGTKRRVVIAALFRRLQALGVGAFRDHLELILQKLFFILD